jgi:hypothetical protein
MVTECIVYRADILIIIVGLFSDLLCPEKNQQNFNKFALKAVDSIGNYSK